MSNVILQDVHGSPGAADVLWRILKERSDESEAHTNISHKELPSRRRHDAFVEDHPFARWFLILDTEAACTVGQLRVTERNEIGISILKKYRRKGYASKALRVLMVTFKPLPYKPSERRAGWVANINPNNPASIALFKKFGFHHIQNTYLREAGDES